MKFYVYILQSDVDSSFYIGHTSNIEGRLESHNNGQSCYTSKKMPWKLVYCESYPTKSDAVRRERFLKQQRNRDFYSKLITSGKAESEKADDIETE
jgi:putative endonuclease